MNDVPSLTPTPIAGGVKQEEHLFQDAKAAPSDPPLPPQFLLENHGHDVLQEHALHLLHRYESGASCCEFLAQLPLFSSDLNIDLNTVAERYQAQVADLCFDNVNSHAALEVVPWIGDAGVYPLVVLLEATARATAIPLVFWLDLVQGFCNAVLHKRAHVQLTERYKTKNRYWTVGTANVAEGKSPAMTPVAEAVERALRQNSAFTVGSVGDQFHLQQAGVLKEHASKNIRFSTLLFISFSLFTMCFIFFALPVFCCCYPRREAPPRLRGKSCASVKVIWLFTLMKLALACVLHLPTVVRRILPNTSICSCI